MNLIGRREVPAKVFFDEPQSRPRVHVGFTPPHLLITSGRPTIHLEAPRYLFDDLVRFLMEWSPHRRFVLSSLLRWGRIRSAERVEAHPIYNPFLRTFFQPNVRTMGTQ